MNILKSITMPLVILLTIFSAIGQSKEDTIDYHLKKGEVLDILLLSNGPEVKTLFPKYRETAFPVATKYSFTPVPGLPIVETLQGGMQPEALVFGKWDSREKREQFLKAIVPAVPDFHEQRRAIWTYFALTYYEMNQDTRFTIDRSKYIVVTSYWGNGNHFDTYIHNFNKATSDMGGKEIITLTNGNSPVGYAYNPAYLSITQWQSKTVFDAFYKKYQAMGEKHIDNVHQFVIQ